MKRAFEALKKQTGLALIDGIYSPNINCKTITIIKGDTKSLSIAAASILAKVSRDNYIYKFCDDYPLLDEHYSIRSNKGYGAKLHIEGIKKHGITKWHRKSFGLCGSSPVNFEF